MSQPCADAAEQPQVMVLMVEQHHVTFPAIPEVLMQSVEIMSTHDEHSGGKGQHLFNDLINISA
jgi:hypothetical protein